MRLILSYRRKGRAAWVALAVAAGLGSLPSAARGQGCCSPSTTPVSALQVAPPVARSVDVGVYYEYFHLRGNLQGTTDVPDPQDRLSRLHIANLSLGYAPWSGLGLRAIVPFARRSREQTLSTPTVQRRDELVGSGLGDISLLAQGCVLPLAGIQPYDVSIGAGVKLPTGGNHQTVDGIRLPLDLQPGTGATDLLLTSYGRYYGWPGWNLYAGHVWRVTSTNGDGYRFGNELQVFTGAVRQVGSRWSVTVEGRWRHAARDSRNFGTRVPSTGSDQLYVAPGAGFSLGPSGPSLLGSVLIPVYERVEGTQLGTSLGLDLALQMRFSPGHGLF